MASVQVIASGIGTRSLLPSFDGLSGSSEIDRFQDLRNELKVRRYQQRRHIDTSGVFRPNLFLSFSVNISILGGS